MARVHSDHKSYQYHDTRTGHVSTAYELAASRCAIFLATARECWTARAVAELTFEPHLSICSCVYATPNEGDVQYMFSGGTRQQKYPKLARWRSTLCTIAQRAFLPSFVFPSGQFSQR